MSKIRVMLQGFVDLNLETDENINTEIPEGDLKLIGQSLIQETKEANEKKELPKELSLIFDKLEIDVDLVAQVRELKKDYYSIKTESKEKRIVVILNKSISLDSRYIKLNEIAYELQFYSIEEFNLMVHKCDYRAVEFLYNSKNENNYKNKELESVLDRNILIENAKSDSDEFWEKGRKSLDNALDSCFLKYFWKSIEVIFFAEQILDKNCISNLNPHTYLLDNMIDSKQIDYSYFNETLSPMRDLMKLKLNSFIAGENLFF